MLLAVNLGMAKHVAEAFGDFDNKIYIAARSSNTNKYMRISILFVFLILGKSVCADEANNAPKTDEAVSIDDKIWIYHYFHEDLRFPSYKEYFLTLMFVSKLTDFPNIKGDIVGYSVHDDIKIPVRIIDGTEDHGFAARSLLNDDNEPEINFSWTFLKYLYKYHADIVDIVFKFVMYHETAHILNGDIYRFSIFPNVEEEIRADSYAADRLRKYCKFDETLEAFLSIHQIYNAFIDHFEDSDNTVKDIVQRYKYLANHQKN